jgi:hypothetical protein
MVPSNKQSGVSALERDFAGSAKHNNVIKKQYTESQTNRFAFIRSFMALRGKPMKSN